MSGDSDDLPVTGCFHGECTVIRKNSGPTKIHKLQPGDTILSQQGKYDDIKCIIVHPRPGVELLSIVENPNGDKVCLTPWHPYKDPRTKQWMFPAENVETVLIECDKVYNFVMKNRSSIIVNGIECCTLAHNLSGDVIEHEFFGTENVVTNLKDKFPEEWNKGYIDCISKTVRSKNTGNIIGFE